MQTSKAATSATLFVGALLVTYLVWRTPSSLSCGEHPKVVSPGGDVVACMFYARGETKVMLDFPGGHCGSMNVTTLPGRARLELRWRDADVLEIVPLAGQALSAESAEMELECRARKVRVSVAKQP